MRRIIVCFLLLCSFAFGVRIGGFELSPEFGFGAQNTKSNGESHSDLSAYGRVWVGVNDFVFAPQVRYNQVSVYQDKLTNWQYGALFGYNFDLFVLYATPFVGLNYSTYDKFYDNKLAYSAGLRVSPNFIPVSASIEYEYLRPTNKFIGREKKMDALRFSVGVSF
ncbi:hypothetical protein DMB92_04415 [Campylobacter sp. MIT 99-7217]|uniref:hypothetical protein n=1 Tax=Campylobacter sp. MIT 99-7217 TaxID=535091 RepID=UPI00115B72C4|nr:hypothetical protein [Campylobacter sp. MIT 99-7217]TQR32347.1 hypothetical protein DMB92_04415 [Campylobacter sp. MIT 99-7217]